MPWYIVHLVTTPSAVFRQQELLTRMAMPDFISELKCRSYPGPFFMDRFVTLFRIWGAWSSQKCKFSVISWWVQRWSWAWAAFWLGA